MIEDQIWFRWNKKNRYSIAALMPLLKGALLTDRPRPGIMLYSIATPQAEGIYREVDSARDGGIDAAFIAGGPHPSARPDEALLHFDYVVIGEGEESLPELIRALEEGRDPLSVRGIALRREGGVVFTGPREPVDLDNYPPFKMPLMAPLEISRGCPWGCAYCQTPSLCGTRMRHRSISVIVAHSRHFFDMRFTSPNALAYGSDGRTARPEKVEALLRALAVLDRPIYFGTFPSEVRPDFVSDSALDLIKRYCKNRTIGIGGQSGSDRVLKRIGRGHGVPEIVDTCERCLDHGIEPSLDLMICLPGETALDQDKTLNLAEWLAGRGGRIRMHRFVPLPGTPLAETLPSPMSDEAASRIGRLVLAGKLTGSWFAANPRQR